VHHCRKRPIATLGANDTDRNAAAGYLAAGYHTERPLFNLRGQFCDRDSSLSSDELGAGLLHRKRMKLWETGALQIIQESLDCLIHYRLRGWIHRVAPRTSNAITRCGSDQRGK